MYAIFKSGGKQYKVINGQLLIIERLKQNIGQIVEFNQVLMIVNQNQINIGAPLVTGGIIKAEVIDHNKGKKIKIIKFRRRKHYRKQQGHRQFFTTVKIINIKS
ncbi:MAG: 50S ribosomal protein L21 [Candidatus Dasytiphilus stammeri]